MAAPGGVALAQGGLDRDHAEHRTQDIDHRGAGAQRATIGAGHVGEADMELHHLVKRRAVGVWAGEVALKRQVDQAGVARGQRLVSAAEFFHCAGAVILQHDIRLFDEAVHRRLALGPLEVQRDATLVAVERGEESGGESAKLARVIAVRRRLHLHHIGAEICQHQPRRRAHDGVAELQHP